MEHHDQHANACRESAQITKQVSCNIHDDKVRAIGKVTVKNGEINIKLTYPYAMATEEATRRMMLSSIQVGLSECYGLMPEAFDPHGG